MEGIGVGGDDVRSVYLGLIEAVNVIQSPGSSNDQRRAAFEYVERVKNGALGNNILQISLELSRAHQHDAVRHLGLSLLEFHITREFSSLDNSGIDSVKRGVIELISQDSESVRSEAAYIQEKLACVVVSVILRSWPQNWPDLFAQLSSAASMGISQLVRVMAVVRSLSEDAFVFYDNMPEKRHRELTSGFKVELPAFVAFMHSQLEAHCRILMDSSSSQDNIALYSLSVNAVLKTLVAFLEWIPLEHIFAYNFLDILIWLLSTSQFHTLAVNCLIIIFCRKAPTEDSAILTGLKITHELGSILATLASEVDATDPNVNREAYELVKKISQAICFFGTNNWLRVSLLSDSNVETTNALARYFEVVLACAEHPSYLISSFTIEVFSNVFNHHNLQPIRQFVLSRLGDCFMTALWIRMGAVDTAIASYFDGDSPSSSSSSSSSEGVKQTSSGVDVVPRYIRYALVDFDDAREFSKFFDQYQSQLRHLARGIITHEIQISLTWVLSCYSEILTQPSAVASKFHEHYSDHPTKEGRSTSSCSSRFSPLVVAYRSLTAFMELVTAVVPMKNWDSKQKETAMNIISMIDAASVQTAESNDGELLLSHVISLMAFYPFIPHCDSNVLSNILRHIFKLMTIRHPLDDGLALSELTMLSARIRRKGCSIMINICRLLPTHLLPILPSLSSQAIALFPSLMHTERIGLCESLVLLSNHLEDQNERERLLQALLASHLETWSSAVVSEAVRSWSSLLQFASIEDTTAAFINRKMISVPLYTFLAMCKRVGGGKRDRFLMNQATQQTKQVSHRKVSSSSGSNAPPVDPNKILSDVDESNRRNVPHPLRNIFAIYLAVLAPLIHSIHDLWSPTVISQIPSQHRSILSISAYERASLAGGDIPIEGSDIATWMYNIRCACYDFFSFLAALPEAYTPDFNLPSVLQSSIFHEVPYMANRHFRSLIQLFLPKFINAVPSEHFLFLDAVLGFLMTETSSRLDKGFEDFMRRKELSSATSSPSSSQSADTEPGNGENNGGSSVDQLDKDGGGGSKEILIDEVEEDKILSKFAQDVFEIILKLAQPQKRKVNFKKGGGGGGSGAGTTSGGGSSNLTSGNSSPVRSLKGGSSNQQTVSLNELFLRLLIGETQSASPILFIVLNGLRWPNNNCFAKAATMCMSLVAVSESDVRFLDMVGRDMFCACAKGLFEHKNQDNQTTLINLLAEIYVKLKGVCAHVTELMMQFPNITPENLTLFNSSLDGEKSHKKRIKMFIQLLQETCGIEPSMKKKQSILDIPQKLFIVKPPNLHLDSEQGVKALFQYSLSGGGGGGVVDEEDEDEDSNLQ